MKKIILSMLAVGLLFGSAMAQTREKMPKNWHLLDPATSGYNGISLDKAYEFLKSKKRKSNQVVVAVIDSGIDTLHEDLKPVLWVNKGEIPGNGIDDDKNGYIDDVHGWNFLGGKDGRNVKEDSYEGARVYHALKPKWENKEVNPDELNAAEKEEYETYLRAKRKIVGELDLEELNMVQTLLPKIAAGDSIIRLEMGKDEYSGKDLANYETDNPDARMSKAFLLNITKANNNADITNNDILNEFRSIIRKAESATTAPPEYRRDIVGDDPTDINDRFYGNNDIMASTPFHGTHVSGIIGAARNNGKGIDGIADNVRLMTLRAVPDGDEHDKDIALAIRYAVDNGAKVINMSFGKDFSPQKHWVDDAFRYADKHGVLLIHAAGNDRKNIDTAHNYPNAVFVSGGRATNLITVGASGDKKNGGYTASFSNYGKNEVDVFAPGVGIYSTIPGDTTYGNASGTSMASPVVAGVAALIYQYYPELTPQQVKQVIEKSAVVSAEKVRKPGTDDQVLLNELSRTGGFVNAYEAVKLADELSSKKPGKSTGTQVQQTPQRRSAPRNTTTTAVPAETLN